MADFVCAADGCPDPTIGPGRYYALHSRLGVRVHADCATSRTVCGEDVSNHAMFWAVAEEAADRG